MQPAKASKAASNVTVATPVPPESSQPLTDQPAQSLQPLISTEPDQTSGATDPHPDQPSDPAVPTASSRPTSFTPTPTPVPDIASDLIRTAYQIREFVTATRRGNEFAREIGIVTKYVTTNYQRPSHATRSKQQECAYPLVWETNNAQLDRAVRALRDRTNYLWDNPDFKFREHAAERTGSLTTQ